MKKVFKIIYIILALIFVIAYFKIKKMPEAGEVSPFLWQEPIQSADTDRNNFDFYYRNSWYSVKPLADYEIWGLVVSQNNIKAWFNYYHDKNSVNFKDVCVLWGDNVRTGAYNQKNIKFSSGEWTCYFQWSGNLAQQFYPNKLSNNHLLADNKDIQATINNLHLGDQIHLKGSLIDYNEKGTTWLRQTSLSRDDENKTSRSGGSCEIIFVDEIEVIKQNKLFWNYIYKYLGWATGLILITNILWVFRNARNRSKD